ncbi:MAG: hypothetical protein HDR01_15265 [Lachnospiraceae bacterium]|nr:hypothetical protein [Lachnospiraceae bacterium]
MAFAKQEHTQKAAIGYAVSYVRFSLTVQPAWKGVHLEAVEPAEHVVVFQARFRSAKTQQY